MTRLVAGVFEAWLGLLLVLVAVAGLIGQHVGRQGSSPADRGGHWVARAAVLAGAAMFAALPLTGPDDGWTAWNRNLARNRARAVLDGAPAAADDRWECYR